MRLTKQRRIILDILEKTKKHPTTEQIYNAVKKRMPHISLGTVYRNLENLSEKGVIRRLDLGDTQRHYDADTSEHFHLRCLDCGEIIDLECKNCFDIDEIEEKTGFEITDLHLEFVGYCPKCKENKQN